MNGKLAIEVTKEGIMNCMCEMSNVSIRDKGLLMHNVASLLEMSDTELRVFFLAESTGHFDNSMETLGEGRTHEEAMRNMEEKKKQQSNERVTEHHFEEGELVKVRDDLISHEIYEDASGCDWMFVMQKYAGCVGHVTNACETDDTYKLDVDDGLFYYPAIFLEPVYDKED